MSTACTVICGERVVRCTLGEPVDRLPFGVGIGWWPWGETLERWRKESGNPKLDVAQEFGFDGSFAMPALECGAFPHFENKVLEEAAEFVVSREWRGITLRNRRDGGSMPEFLDYPVKTPEDWQVYKRERLDPARPGRVAQDWNEFRARLAKFGEAVQVGAFPWGVFGTARDLVGVEQLLYGFYDQPEMIREMLDHLTNLWLDLWEQVGREVQIDHIHIWEDMAGKQGSLISPAMVEEFMMPCYDRIVAFARAHGVRLVSVDTDGDCAQLVPVMMRHGVNVFFPFEVQAGCDILEFRKQYPALGIWGGLDKRALAGSRADIDCEVRRAARMAERGRYIPCFDHLIPPDVPWENYVYAVREMKKVCYGLFGR
jgi:uroporphyrinogen decarboxylase